MTGSVWFEVVSGPGAQERVQVDGELLIGREGPQEGKLGGDRELSRRHARLSVFEDGERLLIEDLGSTNGTFVNGERIERPTVVGAEDRIGLGDSVLRVLPPEPAPPRPGRRVGGVHTVPTNLFATIIARTPVPSDWIIRSALRSIPYILAINFMLRAFAVEYFGVDEGIPSLHPHILIGFSVGPVIGTSFFFWFDFGRRPRERTILVYIIPGILFSCIDCAIELIALPASAGFGEVLTTVLAAAVAPLIVMPTMIGLRARARMRTEAELKREPVG